MSSATLLVKNVFTGAVSQLNPDQFVSLEDLRKWIAKNEEIPSECQLLLTKRSVQVKLEDLVDGQQVYLYDKALIAESRRLSLAPLETAPVTAMPSLGSTGNSIVELAASFVARSKWAVEVLSQAHERAQEIEQVAAQTEVIRSGIEIAVANLHSHSNQLERSYYHKVEFARELEENFGKCHDWEPLYRKLGQVKGQDDTPLARWVDEKRVRRSYAECSEAIHESKSQINSVSVEVIELVNQGHSLEKSVKTWASHGGDNAPRGASKLKYKDLIQDIELVVSRVEKDSEYVASLDDTPNNHKNAKRLAALHDKEFLPQVVSVMKDIQERLRVWTQYKAQCQEKGVDYLRHVSQIQYKTSQVKPKLSELGRTLSRAEDARVVVAETIDLPYLYGIYLVEQVRRSRWLDQMKSMVSESAEALATWKQEESKRRRAWYKFCGQTLSDMKTRAGVDASIRVEHGDEDLPEVDINIRDREYGEAVIITPQDVDQYFAQLLNVGLSECHDMLREEYEQMLKKQDRKKLFSPANKAAAMCSRQFLQLGDSQVFKGGSVMDGGGSSSSSSQLVSQQEAKIKAYETRIRKLEALLHRQQYNASKGSDWSGMATPVPGSSFANAPLTPPVGHARGASDGAIGASMPPYLANRQVSPPPGNNDKMQKLLERIKQLEQQHTKNTERIAVLENTNQSLRNTVNKVNQDKKAIESVKNDLLANMAAQESDFGRERRGLNQEISELKLRIEELEEEVEREVDNSNEVELKQENEIMRLKKHLDAVQLREHENNKSYTDELEKFVAKEHKWAQEAAAYKQKSDRYYLRAKDLSQRLYTSYRRSCELLECMGLQASKEIDEQKNQVSSFKINRVRGLSRRASAKYAAIAAASQSLNADASIVDTSSITTADGVDEAPVPDALYWMSDDHKEEEKDITAEEASSHEEERYTRFTSEVYIDYDLFRDSVCKRFGDVERLARKSQKYCDRAHRAEKDGRNKIAVKGFKEGDLALFLPTRDQTRKPNPWAAFNVGAPHFFLKHDDSLQLQPPREWLVARIKKIEERVVNRATDSDEDNPYDLSDGLKWHLIEAVEER
ncbi:hypothetical protein TRVA0_025S00430 [Trichomonascus vanleenenianus]|uniref:autophagy protein ATG11 n=1 Tax=Trichomonascus vanleenenianus TaxID=2268995 RepID=UPI003EC95D85